MKILCIAILIGLVSIGFVFKNKVYSPILLMPITFTILFIANTVRLYGLYDAENESFIICSLGVTFFVLGCLIEKLFHSSLAKSKLNGNISETISSEVNYLRTFLMTLLIIALFFIIMYSWHSIGYIRSGGTLYDMRYGQQDALHSSGLISFLYTYIGVPILYVSLPIAIYDYFILEKKLYFVLTLIAVFFWFAGNGARLPLIYLILSIACVCLLFFSKIKSQGKLKKILFGLLLVIIVIDILSIARKSGKNLASDNTTFFQGLYYYLGGSMINMGVKLPFVAVQPPLLGVSTFYGFFLPISNVWETKLLDSANYIPDIVQNSIIQISTQSAQPYNFGTTGFFYLFADGKIWGVILISLLLGILANFVYEKFIALKNLKYFVMYSLVMETIFMFALTDLLATISFALSIIYVLILFRTRKSR